MPISEYQVYTELNITCLCTNHFEKPSHTCTAWLNLISILGSFKSRGVVYQLSSIPNGCGTEDRMLLSMSAGNYGKAFAYMTRDMGLKAKVIMPDTAPANRAKLIRVSYNVIM